MIEDYEEVNVPGGGKVDIDDDEAELLDGVAGQLFAHMGRAQKISRGNAAYADLSRMGKRQIRTALVSIVSATGDDLRELVAKLERIASKD